MNVINIGRDAFTHKGEQSMVIVIDEKKYFKSKDEFLDMVSDIEELYEPLTFSDKSKKIKR